MYHTMLTEPGTFPLVQRATFAKGVAFQHDARAGLTEEYESCDVLYMDLPWGERGQAIFNGRARQLVKYDEMLDAVATMAQEARVPTYVVTGKRDATRLPLPRAAGNVVLNGTPAKVLVYGSSSVALREGTPAGDLLAALAAVHLVVGDPFCGYGRAGRVFASHGKGFVMSDYNAQCIGAIALHAARWWPAGVTGP